MTEPGGSGAMPPSVSVARVCMWVQAVVGMAGLLLLFILLGSAPVGVAGGALLFALAVPLVTIVLIGFLAARIESRRGWVRRCGLAVELVLVLVGVWRVANGVSFGNVLGVLLAGVAFALLCRSSSARWFNQ